MEYLLFKKSIFYELKRIKIEKKYYKKMNIIINYYQIQ